MKRIWMMLKIGFLVISFFIITNNFQVLADGWEEIEGSCDTNNACAKSLLGYCTCSDSTNCSGCFIPNGDGGCGTCVKKP